MKTCQVEDCARAHKGHGWCNAHYQRWKLHGDPLAHIPISIRRPEPVTCSVPGCLNRAQSSNQLCGLHRHRWRRHGDPLAGNPGPKVPRTSPRPVVMHDDGSKVCTGCGRALAVSEFDKDKNATGGRRSHCKLCRSQKMKDWYKANQVRQRDRQRARLKANNDAIRQRDAARYERDKEKRIQLATDAFHRRRLRLLGAERSDKGISYNALRKRDGSQCHLCGAEMSFEPCSQGEYNPRRATIEHLTPICEGGLHVWENVALTCWGCNLRRPRRSGVDEILDCGAAERSVHTAN